METEWEIYKRARDYGLFTTEKISDDPPSSWNCPWSVWSPEDETVEEMIRGLGRENLILLDRVRRMKGRKVRSPAPS